MPELAGIMPEVEDDMAVLPFTELASDYHQFTNHGNIEEDGEAMGIIQGYIDKGYLRAFNSLQECEAYLGAKPILSKFACLSRERYDAVSGEWKTKRRVILDSKASDVKSASSRQYRTVLPRIMDAVNDVMHLMDKADRQQQLEHLVLDASDAFWELILHPQERRFYTGRIGNRYLVYLRTAQGS